MPYPTELVAAFQALVWRPPSWTTQRLLLRPLTPQDASDHWAFARLPEVAQHVGWARQDSVADTQRWMVDGVAGHYALGTPYPFAIERLDDPGRMVGTVGCFWAGQRQQRTLELGYVLNPDAWGHGFALEASKSLLDHVFAEYPVWRVQTRIDPSNGPSLKVARALGLREEGVARGAAWSKGRRLDVVVSAVLRPDWPGAPKQMPALSPFERLHPEAAHRALNPSEQDMDLDA